MGPGGPEDMTRRAYRLIEEADLIVGYTVYNDLLKAHFPDKDYYETPMRREKERCIYALSQAAEGKKTVLVCSGDSGVYGMASLALELAGNGSWTRIGETEQNPTDQRKANRNSMVNVSMEQNPAVEIEVIPGVTAALSASALAGAPVSGDAALISLSDLLTPWDVIEKRLAAAAAGDFVIALYNPGSKKRTEHLKKACRIIRRERSGDTVCAIAQNIGRKGETVRYLSLKELEDVKADMFMTILIGNSATKLVTLAGGTKKMVTSRGYRIESEKSAGSDSEKNPAQADSEEKSVLVGSEEKPVLANEKEDPASAGLEERSISPSSEENQISTDAEENPVSAGRSSLSENLRKFRGTVRRYREERRSLPQKRLLIFGGTTEGRMLAEYACGAGIQTLVCVATKYGEKVMAKHRLLEVDSRGLSKSQICELLEENDFFCVFDATHPYAVEITDKISAACEKTGQKYIRVLRDLSGDIENDYDLNRDDDVIFVRSIDEAASLLNLYEGRALITTGSKEIQKYMSVKGAEERFVFRVLPSHEALDACQRAGISGKNMICMQGPFSVKANRAMLKEFHADFLVTKVSGKNGGFSEKIEAARLAQATVIAIVPPDDRTGISMQDAMRYIDDIGAQLDGEKLQPADGRI